MEDFIYIILAIVWLVISVIGGKKKKQQQQSQPSRPAHQPYEEKTAPPPGSEIEDMLEEFFGKSSKNQEQQPEAEQILEYEEEPVLHSEPYSFDHESPHQESLESIENVDYSKYETQHNFGYDYQFIANAQGETLDDIIRQYQESDERAQQEDSKMSVVDLDMQEAVTSAFQFDPRKAVIYYEIMNKKFT
jgi:hypothetical protein